MHNRFNPLHLIISAVLVVFAGRAALAGRIWMPRTFEVFDTVTVVGAVVMVATGHAQLGRGDWLVAIILGVLVAVGMSVASLFTPYPYLNLLAGNGAQAALRGVYTTIALLGGLVIQRRMGPVRLRCVDGDGRVAWSDIGWGLLVGLPLAIVNVYALGFTQGRSIVWQSPAAALLDAFQPAVVEEAVYRFALFGLLWLCLRGALPTTSIVWAGCLSTAIHAFAHVDDLMCQSPLMALGMGTALAVIWGAPPPGSRGVAASSRPSPFIGSRTQRAS